MKKTLFALLACATLVAPAMADETQDFSNTFTLSADGKGGIQSTYSQQQEEETRAVSLTNITSTVSVSGDTPSTGYVGPSEAQDKWEMTFTLTNNTSGNVKISAITLNVAVGKATYPPSINNFSLTSDSWGISGVKTVNGSGSTMSLRSLQYDGEGVTLAAGDTCVFTLKTTRNTNWGTSQTGIQSIKVSGTTPEPATATLSLLALAGLAARRRR